MRREMKYFFRGPNTENTEALVWRNVLEIGIDLVMPHRTCVTLALGHIKYAGTTIRRILSLNCMTHQRLLKCARQLSLSASKTVETLEYLSDLPFLKQPTSPQDREKSPLTFLI
jgi:hypothetical protein